MAPDGRMRKHPMSPKFLMIIAFVFFLSWRKAADSFFLFCALFAAGLCICVIIYREEKTHSMTDE